MQRRQKYSEEELDRIAEIFHDEVNSRICGAYDKVGCPIYTRWRDLSFAERMKSVDGLRSRIERDGLNGYLERKRSQAGNTLTDSIKRRLRAAKFLD